MNVTVTLFHGTAGWVTGILAWAGLVALASETWDRLADRLGRARPRTGWRVQLPDGSGGVVADFYPSVYDQPARVLLEDMTGPDGEHAGIGTWPQAAVVLAFDCTRVKRQTLREAIRRNRPTVTKGARS
jgi:hypothetical protein